MDDAGCRWAVIGRGFNGWHATSSDGRARLSGMYGDVVPERVLEQAIERALVYDASKADSAAFARLVIAGPMVTPTLPPDALERFTNREVATRMAALMEGSFYVLAAAVAQQQFSGLDRVGVGVFEGLLRRVTGMRIGRVQGGSILWEAGTVLHRVRSRA